MQVGGHQDTPPDCFHGFNYTNIHYHGFHVSPSPNADDVLMQIAPGDSFQYAFRIPANQSPGTHWYHPHKHGSVAIQVMNGMTGAIVVDGGPLDSLADAHGMVEKVIAMQQIDSLPNLIDVPPGANTSVPLTLVNGKVTPVIVMRPGEVQRWRLVDENVTKTAAFRVAFRDDPGEEPAMYDVAREVLLPKGDLRPGVDVAYAGDLLVVLLGPEIYRMYVLELGWSHDRWAGWTAQVLLRELFADAT